MPTFTELENLGKEWGSRLLFAQKVNTAVTGIGLIGLCVTQLVIAFVISIYNETLSRKLDGLRVMQTTNIERPHTREDLIEAQIARDQHKGN